ncbi:helix-turn-helix domain-containing protein [Pseudalkalibacillus berkeleyi]|uniref:Helix-turn-helix domain-containing protein n=1 Tax=Pseudalkalibacillus berkeleyi TaxID=1069813 RepID=A0ABS9GXW8_9BACL|nr:helix-turn-helix domain-containing protein [Pseudalkalibacillus berkeleyi]MCF6137612.1 helix-turn-helix domain-containing protein [Pseudalkalibacillus berkeleyi]
MDYRDMIFLYGIKQINGERTISGLFHLLSGKKSSQTVQDGKLFHLSHLFGTFQGYKYASFNEKILQYEQKSWVNIEDHQYAKLTPVGFDLLKDKMEMTPIPVGIDGWRYGDISTIFWRRFTLFIQTLSHLLAGDKGFYPIQNEPEVLMWVRKHFPKTPRARYIIAKQIHTELSSLLKRLEFTNKESDMIVLSLSRYQRVGKTIQQIAEMYEMDSVECQFHYQAAIHQMMNELIKDKQSYLYRFIADIYQDNTLTESTRKTFDLISSGYTIEEVAKVRNLKASTIEDHIVELSIHVKGFQITPYINLQDQRRIIDISTQLQTRKLKDIKTALNDATSYFQIRLTLAKQSDQNDMNKGADVIVD